MTLQKKEKSLKRISHTAAGRHISRLISSSFTTLSPPHEPSSPHLTLSAKGVGGGVPSSFIPTLLLRNRWKRHVFLIILIFLLMVVVLTGGAAGKLAVVRRGGRNGWWPWLILAGQLEDAARRGIFPRLLLLLMFILVVLLMMMMMTKYFSGATARSGAEQHRYRSIAEAHEHGEHGQPAPAQPVQQVVPTGGVQRPVEHLHEGGERGQDCARWGERIEEGKIID